MRILSIFGTRPEAVKMAPVLKLLAQTPEVQSIICVTAQHRQMLDQVLGLFDIRPDFDLNLMRPDQSLAELTAAVFTHLDPVFRQVDPDWVLVQGDTTTAMAASLLAYYHQVRLGHIEAGLRTGEKWQPFPEEINRRVTSVVADLHFAPTEWARQNLLREGIAPEAIRVTGNPVIDALNYVVSLPLNSQVYDLLDRLELRSDHPPCLVLVTTHRRENFGRPLDEICTALQQLAEHYGSRLRIVYPVHLNPNVQEPVHRLLAGLPNVALLPPLDYAPLVQLMKRATLVLTDLGGLQEEAPGFGVPVLVLRHVTERPEGVEAGTVRLVGTDYARIVKEARNLLDDPRAYAAMAQAINPYGDGHASEKIVECLLSFQPKLDKGIFG